MQSENDREVADRTKTDTEFLAREIAGVRLMLADVVTGEELRDQLADPRAPIDVPMTAVERDRRRPPAGLQPGQCGMPVNSCSRTP